MPGIKGGDARVRNVFSFPIPIKYACMFHHSLGLSIWSAYYLWQGVCCVRNMYGCNVIGWSAAAFRSLCPYDIRDEDDHRSHFILMATLVIRVMLYWFTIVCCLFLWHCCFFLFTHFQTCCCSVLTLLCCAFFCDSVLSFLYVPSVEIKKGGLVTPPGGAAQSLSSPQGLTYLEPFEAIWSHMEPFGGIWSYLEPFRAAWSNL